MDIGDITGFITGLVAEAAKEVGTLGLIEKFIAFFETNSIVTFIIFAISLFFLYKMVKLAFKIFLIVIAGVLFPFAMNYLFGWNIPITIAILLFYATAAVVLFLLGMFILGIGKFLKVLTSPSRKKREIEHIEEEIEKDLTKGKKKH